MFNMLKYGCCCINCINQSLQGSCKVEYFRCDSNYEEGKCPVTKCYKFEPKEILAQEPCIYFGNIEKGGLYMLSL